MAQQGPAEFINPIIQAMIATAQGQRQAADLAERTRANKAEEDFRNQQLTQAHNEFTARQAEEAKVHESEADFRKAQIAHEQNQQSLSFYDALHTGAVIPQAIGQFITGAKYNPGQQIIPQNSGGGLSVPGSITLPGGQEISENQLPSPERTSQSDAARAGSIVSAQEAAREPFNIAADTRRSASEQAKQLQDQKNRLVELGITGANSARVANINAAARQSDANLNGYYHLKGIAQMHQFGLDDSTGQNVTYAKQLTDSLFNGTTDYSKLTQDQKRLVDGYTAGTGENPPTNGKDYAAKLDTIGSIQGLFNQARHLAVNYSMDAPGGGSMAQFKTGGLLGIIPKSPLNSELDTFKSSGGQLASMFDEQKRKSDAEIMRQTVGVFDPKATTAENLTKLQQQQVKLNQVVKNTFSGFNPDRVNSILSQRGITDFGNMGSQQSKHSYIQTRVDPQTGHAIGTDGQKWYDVASGQELH